MVNDPIGDMIIQIKNAGLSGRDNISLPYSKVKNKIAEILKNEGYIKTVSIEGEKPKMFLKIFLKYENKKSVITDVKRRSKPGLRIYINKRLIPNVVGGLGIAIISTSQGIMTGSEARKQGLGGELLCEIW